MSDSTTRAVLDAYPAVDNALLRWCDAMRQATEDRLGLPAGDSRAIDDAAYAAVLNVYAAARRAYAAIPQPGDEEEYDRCATPAKPTPPHDGQPLGGRNRPGGAR